MGNEVMEANHKPNAVAEVRVLLERLKPQMAMALPKHLTPERLVRVTMTAVQANPKLLECDRNSFFAAIMSCAALGLEPDGVLGQAYLVPFAGRVQFIPGYKGLISLARNSGEVLSIEAHEVRERDHFHYEFGLNQKLEHRPARGERGEITYFYAIARFKDGGYHWDVMSVEEVQSIRNNSSGWKTALKLKKEAQSPWGQHYVEMGKKTAIRRIAKYLPMSVQKAAAISEAYDTGRHATINEFGELQIAAEKPAEQLEDKSKPAAEANSADSAESVNAETGEVTSDGDDNGKAAAAVQAQLDQLDQFEAA